MHDCSLPLFCSCLHVLNEMTIYWNLTSQISNLIGVGLLKAKRKNAPRISTPIFCPQQQPQAFPPTSRFPNLSIRNSDLRQQTKMLPATLNLAYDFEPIGFTPPQDLTGALRPEEDAKILLLGNGDVRNLLFTVASDRDPIGGQGRPSDRSPSCQSLAEIGSC